MSNHLATADQDVEQPRLFQLGKPVDERLITLKVGPAISLRDREVRLHQRMSGRFEGSIQDVKITTDKEGAVSATYTVVVDGLELDS